MCHTLHEYGHGVLKIESRGHGACIIQTLLLFLYAIFVRMRFDGE
jgi:hypothetical protein